MAARNSAMPVPAFGGGHTPRLPHNRSYRTLAPVQLATCGATALVPEHIAKVRRPHHKKYITGGGSDIAYRYSASGERLSKTVGGETTEYVSMGGAVLQEKNDDYTLNYHYDSAGLLVSIGYDGDRSPVDGSLPPPPPPSGTKVPNPGNVVSHTSFFVTRNLQGDIIALYSRQDSSLIGTYVYDAWGKVIGVKDAKGDDIAEDAYHIMNMNPFRYRGYYYDRETNFYFLQSRYYDPEIKRFINADGLISTGTGVMGYNMYAYCENNPVNLSDPTGTCSHCAATYSAWAWKPQYNPNGASNGPYFYNNSRDYAAALVAWWNGYNAALNKTHFTTQYGVDINNVDERLINAVNEMGGAYGVTITISDGYRSVARQNAMRADWDAGIRTGMVAQPAKGGASWHNYGGAIDMIIWDSSLTEEDYGRFGIYQPLPIKDPVHFQLIGIDIDLASAQGPAYKKSITTWGGR